MTFESPQAKHLSLNKVGHALHTRDSVFKQFVQQRAIAQLVKDLGYKSPEIPQTMFICKQPRIGGEVVPHQVCMYMRSPPRAASLGDLACARSIHTHTHNVQRTVVSVCRQEGVRCL